MKKIVNIVLIFLVLFLSSFLVNSYAAELTGVNVTTDKQTVHPNENVKVNISFGTNLGAYTVDIAYDNNLFDYVSAEGGTANDTGAKVRVAFYDQTGGSNPRNNMSVTFKAKSNITTSNPTDFSITAEGLANADASVSYDDITTPIIKNIIVEPQYVDYTIALNYTGNVIKNVEKDMKLVISSTMGRNYEHTRIIAEVTGPTGGVAKLLAKDAQGSEHDIIQSGWGDAQGDAIGGKDVVKELDVKGLFNKAGDYTITLKLIDRDNSDSIIQSKNFKITVKETASQESNDGNTNNNQQSKPNQGNTNQSNTPESLPKTGNTIYYLVIPIIAISVVAYMYIRKKD